MEDYCAVCAEPLEFVAYGRCGHMDTCSKCVARLRFVLNDTRCVICQQKDSPVVVTHYSGEYTAAVPAEEFPKLKARSGRGGDLYHLPAVDAFFDDEQHFQHIRELCGYTHPAVEPDGGKAKRFSNLKELKRALEASNGLHFCNICLEGRKVFISEQVVYTKPDLQVHAKSGDLVGPLAEAGFKGHPSCRFCRKSFYGDNELFAHMQQSHEQCFLCRRARPDKYVYYRDYNELEGHFRNEHYLCDQPQCQEARFVVFASEQEFKQHRAREHAEGLSRGERRAAMTIPVNLNYRRGDQADPGPSGMEFRNSGRPGITIGGAEGVTSRFRRSRQANEQQQIADAMQASLHSHGSSQQLAESAAPQMQRAHSEQQLAPVEPEEDPFPGLGAASGAAIAGSSRWAAAAGAAGRSGVQANDFPELPSASSGAARRRAAQSRTLAERLAASSAGVRLVRAADPGAAPPAANSTGPRRPALPHSASEPSLQAAGPAAAAQGNNGSRPASPVVPPAAGGRPTTGAPQWGESQEVAAPSTPQNGFPALSASRPRAAAAAGNSGWVAVGRGQRQPAQQQPASRADQFPALGGRPAAPAPQRAAKRASGGSSAAAAVPAAAPSSGGVSEGLKAANKAFIERLRKQLGEDDFASFRGKSADFMQGRTSAALLHAHISKLGVASVVPELAALCPQLSKRSELLAVHRQAFQEAAGPSGHGRGWVPPEAAAAAADHAERNSSWQCAMCTLVNSPAAATCEACTASRPPSGSTSGGGAGSASQTAQEIQQAQEALLNNNGGGDGADSRTADGAAEPQQQPKGKGKPKKLGKFERLRLTSGDGNATLDWLDSNGQGPKKNAWGSSSSSSSSAARTAAAQKHPQNPWANVPGQLAQTERVVQDAWSRR